MNEFRTNSDLLPKVAGFLFGFAFTNFWIFLLVMERWVYTAPNTPNPALKQIYQHNEHGSMTYFTAFQATSSALMFGACFLAGGLAIVLMPKRAMKVTRLGRLPLGASWKHDDPKQLAKGSAIFGAIVSPIATLIIGPMLVPWLNSLGIVFNL